MNHEIVSKGKIHGWLWLNNHSRCSVVEHFKGKGFGAIAILPYFFEQNGRRNASKKVVIHCGSKIRVISYTGDWKAAEDLTNWGPK